jgi:hypothetical protein
MRSRADDDTVVRQRSSDIDVVKEIIAVYKAVEVDEVKVNAMANVVESALAASAESDSLRARLQMMELRAAMADAREKREAQLKEAAMSHASELNEFIAAQSEVERSVKRECAAAAWHGCACHVAVPCAVRLV